MLTSYTRDLEATVTAEHSRNTSRRRLDTSRRRPGPGHPTPWAFLALCLLGAGPLRQLELAFHP